MSSIFDPIVDPVVDPHFGLFGDGSRSIWLPIPQLHPLLWWSPADGLTVSGGYVTAFPNMGSAGTSFVASGSARPTAISGPRGYLVPAYDGVANEMTTNGTTATFQELHEDSFEFAWVGVPDVDCPGAAKIMDDLRASTGRRGISITYGSSSSSVAITIGSGVGAPWALGTITVLPADEWHVFTLEVSTATTPQARGTADGFVTLSDDVLNGALGVGPSFDELTFGATAGAALAPFFKGEMWAQYARSGISGNLPRLRAWYLRHVAPDLWYRIDAVNGYLYMIQRESNLRLGIQHHVSAGIYLDVWRLVLAYFREAGFTAVTTGNWEHAFSIAGALFFGGSHGGEQKTASALTVDGSPVSLSARSRGACSTVVLTQTTNLLHPTTHAVLAVASVSHTITTDTIVYTESLEWLAVVDLVDAYCGMVPALTTAVDMVARPLIAEVIPSPADQTPVVGTEATIWRLAGGVKIRVVLTNVSGLPTDPTVYVAHNGDPSLNNKLYFRIVPPGGHRTAIGERWVWEATTVITR